jgi:hypothetical protein
LRTILGPHPRLLPPLMPAVTRETLGLTQDQLAATIGTQLLVTLCVKLLLYGAFTITTLLTIRALVGVHKTPYQSWKSRWHFVSAACVIFIIDTCDVAFTIWIKFFAILTCLDDQQIPTSSTTDYNTYTRAHVRYILAKAIKLELKAHVLVRKLPFTCKSLLWRACS